VGLTKSRLSLSKTQGVTRYLDFQLSYISANFAIFDTSLSLDVRTFIEPGLLLVEGLHLESLHLSFRMLIDEPNLREVLDEIVKGEIGGLKGDRIVICGHKLEQVTGNRFEPRCDRDSPPFEDVDGR